MTGIEKLRNLSATLGEGQPFTIEGIYIGGKTASEWFADVADQIERETLPRPRFEDGELVQFGDEFLGPSGVCAYEAKMFKYYSDGRVVVDGILGADASPLKRPESSDSWERIEDDIVNKVNPCVYFGWSGKECGEGVGCPGHGPNTNCSKVRAQDLVHRCKALAGVE